MTSESSETAGSTQTTGEGRVSWRRLLAGFAVTGSAAAVLVVLTAQGVLAANFSVSGMPFTVTPTSWTAPASSSSRRSTRWRPTAPTRATPAGSSC